MSGTDDLPAALERLVALGQTPDINIRPVLLRVVVDLFVGKHHHAPADLQQFEAIVSHLLDDADLDARLIVAEKLSRHPSTPRRLLDRFIADRSAIARKIYENAELDPGMLLSAATWAPADVAAGVAGRSGLSAATIMALAERPEPEVVLRLAQNLAAPLDRRSFQHLARRARTDQELAELLVDRAADPIDLAPLFPVVGPDQRRAIIEGARRLELGKRQWGRPDGASVETIQQLDRLVLGGERDGFEAALSLALGIDGGLMAPLLNDESGEILALALAAIGAPPEMAARVFILGDPRIACSVHKVRALTQIVETLSAHAARRLIGAMTGFSLEAGRRTSAGAKHGPLGRRAALQAPATEQGSEQSPARSNPAAAAASPRARLA